MFMSKDAFMDVRHSTTTAVHDHDNEKDIDTRRSSVNLDALIVPVPPPPRAHMSSGFENQQQHTTTAPRFRPMPPPAPHSSVGDGGGIAHKPATGGGGGGSRASQRNYSRSFGMVEDHGKIYDNDLFFGDGGTATPVHDFQKSNTNVSDMDTTISAKSDILKNTLNQPATRRDQENASSISSQRLENQKELQAARRRERKTVGVLKSNDTGLKSIGRPPSASSSMRTSEYDRDAAQSSESSPDSVLDKMNGSSSGMIKKMNMQHVPSMDVGRAHSHIIKSEPVTQVEKEVRASGISSMEYDPSHSSRSDSNFEEMDDNSFILKLDGVADTRPILSTPGPRHGKVRCYIIRDKGFRGRFPTYHLFMENGDRFLLSARRRKGSKSSNYLVSTDPEDLTRDSKNYFGKLRSNFVGTEFTLYDDGISGRKAGLSAAHLRKEMGAVTYETNVFGTKGPRKMMVYVPSLDGPERNFLDGSDGLVETFKSGDARGILALKNKQPHWNEELCAYCLNFNGRVSKASVKNFQLEDVHCNSADSVVYLQFGKVGEDRFTMDYQYPLSALQSFMICLTSFDNKWACE